MRLHRLDLQAFGPFAGQETIDFDSLAGSGIFLLNGPTGAGKTSILDAISYALYGKVPGARNDQHDDLRCHVASSDNLTEVTLEFTVRGRRLRVTRAPTQTRRKRTGEGTTTHSASATLQELTGSTWTGLASKVGDVTTMVADLLGLNAAQFQQVILLPQGEFARFLRAGPADRQALLQAVFDTSRFESIEAWLKAEADHLATGLNELSRNVDAAVAECAGALGVNGPDDSTQRAWLNDHEQRLADIHAESVTEQEAAKVAVDAAVDGVTASMALADKQRRFHTAAQDELELVSALASLDDLRERLTAARRAASVRPLLDTLDSLAPQTSKARDQRIDAETALGAVRPELVGAGIDELIIEGNRLDQLAFGLDRVAKIEAVTLPTATQAAATASDALRAANNQFAALTIQSEELEASLAEDRSMVAEGAQAAARIGAAVEARGDAQRRLDNAADREKRRAEHTAAETALKSAANAWSAAVKHRQVVFAHRMAGISAELATELVPDAACPVCGSTEHPAPAQPTDDHASQADLDAADAEVTRLAAEVASLTTTVEGLAYRITQLTDAVGDEELSRIQAKFDQASDLLDSLNQMQRNGEEANQRIAQADERRQQLDAKLDATRLEIPRLEAEVKATEARVADLSLEVDDARDRYGSVGERLAAVRAERECIAAVNSARTDERLLTTRLDETRQRAMLEATEQGFADLDAARTAVLDAAEQVRLNGEITAIEAKQAAIQAVVTDPELVQAAALPPADPDAANAALATARQVHDEATRAVTVVTGQIEALKRCQQILDTADSAGGEMRERHEVVRTLADLARGGSGNDADGTRMRLSNYVLSARLGQVTDAASLRLRAMTEGRYTLLQTDDAGHRGRQGGLGIEVLDAHSGRTRGTNSLSGGESFAASLALALGLADVVAAESGGVSLETLFIDEGFGTLDDESLNAVLDILDGLRSGGRTVGVVSHVADMKERISTHVRVERRGRVSHIIQ